MPRSVLMLLLSSAALLIAGCADSSSPTVPSSDPAAPPAVAFGIWTPGSHDSCTRQAHDHYAVTGPDGKRYPTWHPPVDPLSGCTIGHEHGRDPRRSALYATVGDIPFGLAHEALDVWAPALRRHEDHVGHKIDRETDVLTQDGSARPGSRATSGATSCSSCIPRPVLRPATAPGSCPTRAAWTGCCAARPPSRSGAPSRRGTPGTGCGRPKEALAFLDPDFEGHTPRRFYDEGAPDRTGRFIDTCPWPVLSAWPLRHSVGRELSRETFRAVLGRPAGNDRDDAARGSSLEPTRRSVARATCVRWQGTHASPQACHSRDGTAGPDCLVEGVWSSTQSA